jgi:hypothetical protein
MDWISFRIQEYNPSLTLIQTAGGVYDFRNFEQKQIKMAWIKNTFLS